MDGLGNGAGAAGSAAGAAPEVAVGGVLGAALCGAEETATCIAEGCPLSEEAEEDVCARAGNTITKHNKKAARHFDEDFILVSPSPSVFRFRIPFFVFPRGSFSTGNGACHQLVADCTCC
jgi:hypothetical protein